MKRMAGLIACVAVAACLSACGGSKVETPEEAFRLMKDAVAAKDYDKVIDLMSRGDQKKLKDERSAVIKSIRIGMKKNRDGTVKMLEEVYGVSSIAELEKMKTRKFIVRRAQHADKTGKGTGFLAKIAERIDGREFVKEEMGKKEKTAFLVVKKDGKEDRIHAVLEDDGWKIDFSK